MGWLFVPGIGGLELGVKLARPDLHVVCHVEWEAFAAAVLVARMEDASLAPAPVWDDLLSFDGRPWCGIVDLITAGFPCQPFSSAGKRKGLRDDRWIWPDIARVIREVRPSLVFLENVPGLAPRGLWRVLGDLSETGFDAEWDLFSAAEAGAPHIRKRLFILAVHRSLPDTERNPLRFQRQRYGQQHGLARAPIARADVDMADPDADGLGRIAKPHTGSGSLRPESSRGHAQRCDPPLADPTCFGERESRHSDLRSDGRQGSRRTGRDVPDAARKCGSRRYPARSVGSGSLGIQPFPPSPADLSGWARVLAEVPEIEPALCRVAHEHSARLDRLRALGNGVVPIVAARAFCELAGRVSAR